MTVFRWRGGKSISWQVTGLILVWLYIVLLHWQNDGLWYPGDAPRHAANGLFWWDLIADLPLNPVEFALGYYARYPVINPIAYPPGFYLLEGAAFRLFGASPFVAKGLVLAFALFAGIYATVWLRRWVSEEAGWAGSLLLLQPGNVIFSHAIMLNVPAMALSLAALYHARRWIEVPSSRHIYAATLFLLLGVLTYFHCGIVLLIVLTWVIADRRWMAFGGRRTVALIFLSVLVLVPAALAVLKWAPTYVAGLVPGPWALKMAHWTFYLVEAPRLLTPWVLGLAVAGVLVGAWDQRWRKEIKLAVIWILVGYIALSSITMRDIRYALVFFPPVIILSVVPLCSLFRWGSTRVRGIPPWCFVGAIGVLLAIHVVSAPLARVPRVEGFREIVEFFERVAPKERVFYQGYHNGVFSFYLRSGDDDFQRGVVLGSKLLYVTEVAGKRWFSELVASRSEVLEFFRTRCGCRWLAIEARAGEGGRILAIKYLRQALGGEEFRFVKSFEITSPRETRVDVYEFLPPAETPEKLEIRLPRLGDGTVVRVRPLDR